MPDMTVEIMQMCKSIQGPRDMEIPSRSDPDTSYTVRNMFSERHYPECDCPAYKFAKRTVPFGPLMFPRPCRHILQAERSVCSWHQLYGERQSDEQQRARICPRCGGPTVFVRVAT
jgi:hypothetical protein